MPFDHTSDFLRSCQDPAVAYDQEPGTYPPYDNANDFEVWVLDEDGNEPFPGRVRLKPVAILVAVVVVVVMVMAAAVAAAVALVVVGGINVRRIYFLLRKI